MQKILSIALFAVIFAGFTISPALAQDDQRVDDLERDFEQKRQDIEQYYDEKYRELDAKYSQYKEELFEKIEENNFSEEEANSMYEELISFYEEKLYKIDSEKIEAFEELEKMFHEEIERLEENSEYSDKKYDDSREYQEYDQREHFESDPEWPEIQPLAQKITDIIPIEKIQKLWMSPQHEKLVEIIVSETDLTRGQANKVIKFFERVEQDDNKEHQREKNQVQSLQIDSIIENHDDSEITRLNQVITELQEENDLLQTQIVRLQTENDSLQDTIADLEEKIDNLNAIVMEQIKIIYEWVLGQ